MLPLQRVVNQSIPFVGYELSIMNEKDENTLNNRERFVIRKT